MTTVVVTGGIGSGKSTLCHFLEEKGIPVFDSDAATRSLYVRRPEIVERVARAFGPEVLDGECGIDRKALAKVVFSDPEKLKTLESIAHPAVYQDFEAFRNSRPGVEFVVFESAIVLQRGFPKGLADEIVYVDAPLELRVARASKRDGRSEEETMKRVEAQQYVADDPRITKVITNDGTPDELREKAARLYEELKRKYHEN